MAYKHFNVVTDGDSGLVFVNFDREGQSVNTFNKEAMLELEQIVDGLSGSDASGVIFASAKKSWIAGADISEFFELFDAEDQVILDVVKKGHEVFNKIEDLEIPTVAWINGAAMGGGTELALACTYRVANSDGGFQIALPETKLGILPAWGGTTRMPRLIGADHAIDLICSGRSVRHDEALKLGLVDALFDGETNEVTFFNDMVTTAKESGAVDKVRKKKTGPVKLNMIEAMMTFKFAGSQVKAKAGKHYPAPMRALGVMEACRKMKRDEALESEALAFLELIKTEVASHLINIFVNERKLKAEANALDAHSLDNIVVLGAGAMGGAIAFALANKAGKKVTLYDPYPEQLEKARQSNREYLMKKVQKKYITLDELNRVMDLIEESSDLQKACSGADFVVEAIPEVLSLKQKTMADVFAYTADNCILATNTSFLQVEDVFDVEENYKKENTVGMHFFNPVSKMPLVEIVKGPHTSDTTLGATAQLAMAMGKTPLITGDCPGFVVNRVLLPYLVEADKMAIEGYNLEAIDKVMKSYGWPMGPYELLDMIGLDVAVHCVESMPLGVDTTNSVIKKLNDEGNKGQKTSSGFYSWKGTKKGAIQVSGSKTADAEEIENRLLTPMRDEARKILDEGIVDADWKINMGLIMGLAFPPFRGGIL